jgi:hypothetical protein
MLKRLMMVLAAATLAGGLTVTGAQARGGGGHSGLGRSPSTNSSNPQDRSGSGNPQDMTQPRAINPQDMNPPSPNIVMPLSR